MVSTLDIKTFFKDELKGDKRAPEIVNPVVEIPTVVMAFIMVMWFLLVGLFMMTQVETALPSF